MRKDDIEHAISEGILAWMIVAGMTLFDKDPSYSIAALYGILFFILSLVLSGYRN